MGILISALYRSRHIWPVLRFRGLSVPVNGPHVSRPVWKHIWRGTYEAPELDALDQLVRPGDRVLELGCGMGLVSGALAKRLPDLAIRSYEANPVMIPVIRDLHARNGIANVDIRNAILLPAPTEPVRRLNLHQNFTESSIMAGIASETGVEVPVQDFNAELADFRPDVLVCDIEGAEEELFRGVSLAGLRGLVLELHPALVSRAAIAAIFDSCAAAGLYPRIEWSRKQVVAFERVDPGAAAGTGA